MALLSTAKKVATGLLDMDTSSRIARAKEQGYSWANPLELESIGYSTKVITNGSPEAVKFSKYLSEKGIPHKSHKAKTGSTYITLEGNPYTTNKGITSLGDLEYRFSDHSKDKYKKLFNNQKVDNLFEADVFPNGHTLEDAIRKVESTGGIRSVDAAFDPAKISSSNLLASNPVATAAAGAGGLLAVTGSDDADAGVVGSGTKVVRGLMDQYDMDLYHSTYADINQFDPDMVDIGVHLGTPQQATNRLNDTFDPTVGNGRYNAENYRSGANVIPVKVRSGGVLEMEDAGDWKDSQQVLSELTKNPLFENDPVINDLIGYADEIQPSYYGGEMSWRDSPENREVLDDIRNHLQSKGFDTVKYLNQVENAYGSDAGLTEAATKSRDLLFKQINEIQKVAHSRGPDINSVPDPSAPNFQEKMDAFLNGKPSYTNAESVELDKLRADARLIANAPESQIDPNSYISLDPERNVRSRFAKFESERGNLLASNPVATTSAALMDNVTGKPSNLSSYMQGNTDAYLTNAERQYLQNKQAFESNFSDDTGWDRADILPFRVNEQTGEREFATPEMIKGLLSGLYDIGQSKNTKISNPASLLELI